MKLEEFKVQVKSLIKDLVVTCDAKVASLLEQIKQLTTELESLKAEAIVLRDKVAASGNTPVIDFSSDLEDLTNSVTGVTDTASEIVTNANPSPAADSLAQVVDEAPAIATPSEVVAAVSEGGSIDTPTPTSEAVVDAATDAIVATLP